MVGAESVVMEVVSYSSKLHVVACSMVGSGKEGLDVAGFGGGGMGVDGGGTGGVEGGSSCGVEGGSISGVDGGATGRGWAVGTG